MSILCLALLSSLPYLYAGPPPSVQTPPVKPDLLITPHPDEPVEADLEDAPAAEAPDPAAPGGEPVGATEEPVGAAHDADWPHDGDAWAEPQAE